MAKKPPTLAQQYAMEYASKLKERVSDDDKNRSDISEIGCSLVRIWTRRVKILKWRDKGRSVVVEVDGEVSTYNWPFHTSIVFPFINFEVLEDCGYMDRLSNGTEYVIDGKRYGVKDDVVWAGGKRYLSSFEKVKFGSFHAFLVGKEFCSKKTII